MLTFNRNRNNEGNYIIQEKEEGVHKFYIIDHGHCFVSPKWDSSLLKNNIETWNQNVLPEMVSYIEGLDSFRFYINKIKSMSNEFISKLVDEVPSEWGITFDEREALKSFLIRRRDIIENIISQSKNFFFNWKQKE